MSFQQKYTITPRYLTSGSKRRSGLPLNPGVKFLVAHDTGNPNSTAANNVKYYERSRDEESASAHLFVDDHEILECIPALTSERPEKAWHVLYRTPVDNQLFGYDANDAALGIEYCYGTNIDADEAYRKYVWVLAYCCDRYGLDPARVIVGHFFLDPQRKTDPVTGLAHSRRTYEQLLRDVVSEYQACGGAVSPSVPLPKSGAVVTSAKLNIREGAPSVRAPIHQTVVAGTRLAYTDWTDNGDAVNGNSRWYADASGNFFWSGGVRIGD